MSATEVAAPLLLCLVSAPSITMKGVVGSPTLVTGLSTSHFRFVSCFIYLEDVLLGEYTFKNVTCSKLYPFVMTTRPSSHPGAFSVGSASSYYSCSRLPVFAVHLLQSFCVYSVFLHLKCISCKWYTVGSWFLSNMIVATINLKFSGHLYLI